MTNIKDKSHLYEGYPEMLGAIYNFIASTCFRRTANPSNTHAGDFVEKHPAAGTTSPMTYMALSASIEKITHGSTLQLLNVMAFFASDGVRLEWFVRGVESLPEPLRTEIADQLERDEIIQELTKCLPVHVEEGTIGINRLLMEVVRDTLGIAGKYEEYGGYARGVGEKLCFFDFPTRESRDTFQDLYPHIEAVVRHSASRNQDARTATLCSFLGNGAKEVLCNYDLALEWFGKAVLICENVEGKNHADTARVYSDIAKVYDKKGEYDRALEWHKKALTIREEVFGKEHPDTAKTYNNIAIAYDDKGDYDRALEWYEKALAIREKILGEEHSDTAKTYNNIAIAYDNKGDYDRALEWYGKAMAIREKVLGTEHPDTAGTYNNIANVYFREGAYDCALEWHEKALTIQEKVFGKEHPDTAGTYNNIAIVYDCKGEYDHALELLKKALAIRENVFGKEHPETAGMYNNIASVYRKKDEYDRALEWHEKALAVREKVLGNEHPDTV